MTPSIFVALPIYGWVEPYFFASFLNMERRLHAMEDPPFTIKVEMVVGDPTVGFARNALAARFLKSDCTHLLFLDIDLTFTFDDIVKLLAASNAEPPCIACGKYALKIPEPQWTYKSLPGPEQVRPSGLIEVARAATGFMLIDRMVLEVLRDGDPALRYLPEDGDIPAWNFFNAHVNAKGRFVREDYAFCDLARVHGFQVFIHPDIVCRHVGRALYPL